MNVLYEVSEVIDAHEPVRWVLGRRCHCTCGLMVEGWSVHVTEALYRAGLLAEGPPGETPTARVLAERGDRSE